MLALLWFRAFLWQTKRALAPPHGALACRLLVASLAGLVSWRIPERYGSARDVVIDVSGAAGALLIARGRMAARERAQVRSRIAVEPVE